MSRPRVRGVVIPSEALVLSEAKELSAFPFLSSSTFLIENPASLFLLSFVAAASHAASLLLPLGEGKGEGALSS